MSDADNWPSNFHAHDLEGAGEKLDLYTGNVYDIPTKQHKRKLKKKVMRYIYNQELRSSNNSVIAAKCTERASFDYLA